MATIYIDYRTISWGAPNEDDSNNVWQVEDGNNDPGEILLANFGNVASPVNNWYAQDPFFLSGNPYQFAFWNATDGTYALPGFPSPNPLNIPDLPSGVVHATAWYALPGGGPGTPGLRARTFDVDLNNFRKETPIQSVAPPAAWPGPNSHSASTQTASATVTPKGTLNFPAPAAQQPPGELPKYFQHWQTIVGTAPIAAAPAQTIQCGQNQSALAVAFFGRKKPTKPPIGKPATGSIYDYWAEFWGERGAESEGPFGPLGPGTPWGPDVARAIEKLSPVEQGMVLGVLNGVFKSGNIKGGNVKG
jgi:hypothetical protein